MIDRALILAQTARTAVGLRGDTTAAAVRAGISRLSEHNFLVDGLGAPLVCGCEPSLAPDLLGADRIAALLERGVQQVLDTLSRHGPLRTQIPTFMALPEERPGFSRLDLDRMIDRFADKRWSGLAERGVIEMAFLPDGHAGFARCVERALACFERGGVEFCLVGGADSYFDADTLDWLDVDRKIAREGVRGGFPPGEGVGVLALATSRFCAQIGLPPLGCVAGVASAVERASPHSDEGLQGLALTQVYRNLVGRVSGSGLYEEVFTDINDERSRTTDYAFAQLRCGELFRDGNQYLTCVGQTGEIGAASGAVLCVLAAQAFARGYAHGDNVLVSLASWNGLRGAVLLERA